MNKTIDRQQTTFMEKYDGSYYPYNLSNLPMLKVAATRMIDYHFNHFKTAGGVSEHELLLAILKHLQLQLNNQTCTLTSRQVIDWIKLKIGAMKFITEFTKDASRINAEDHRRMTTTTKSQVELFRSLIDETDLFKFSKLFNDFSMHHQPVLLELLFVKSVDKLEFEFDFENVETAQTPQRISRNISRNLSKINIIINMWIENSPRAFTPAEKAQFAYYTTPKLQA